MSVEFEQERDNVSQLISKLKIAARLEPLPLGFTGVSKAAPKPKPVLIARIKGDEKQAAELVQGADGVFIDTHQEEIADRFIKLMEKEPVQLPYGCWLGNNSACNNDFYMLNFEADMSTIKATDTGKILLVEPEVEDKFLRQLDDLPVDAILVGSSEGQPCRLTIKNYMLCHRIAVAVSKPLIIHAGNKIGSAEIEEMWEYGIDGVMVDIDSNEPAIIASFRELLDKLDLSAKRKKIRLTPVIPGIGSGSAASSHEPEPDEEGDDDEEDDSPY
ncbi:MAG: hypothetical protein JW954_04450 [Dehalococcoidaceae bacterium]|nr:hypothetical protein [Dehalococcoidaceae bacterium]